MILIMGVTLYTSRVVLEVLGADDYGLYFTIFSVIGMLSFLNGTLSGGTSRFITFELGTGDEERLKTTFSTALSTHLMLSGIILLLGATVGLWYANDVLKVPDGQRSVALWVYLVSVISTIVSILQVPFIAEIIAHERMNVYAYLGIYEALAKLGVVFLLLHTSFVKIVFYAWLQLAVSGSVFLFYVLYNLNHFPEITFKNRFDKNIFKSMMSFSGWNIIANICNTLSQQGVIILFNFFFSPVVVAAQAISNQISQAAGNFVNNIRQAVNPQVIKLYADKQFKESQKLTLKSAEYIFYLLLLIGVPVIMVMPRLLSIWLTEVPEYSVAFARLMIIQLILDNFNSAFYTPMVAANKISKNAIWGSTLCGIQFVMTWLIFKIGGGPLWARYLAILTIIIFSFFIKPYILCKDINYPIKEMLCCIYQCLKAALPIALINAILYFTIPQKSLRDSVLILSLSVLSILSISYLLIGKSFRNKIFIFIKSKI